MGLNAYFAFEICGGSGLPWQDALGIVFIAGMLFLILSFVGIREAVMNAFPTSLQNAIAIGIGLFIAFIGLQMSGIITKDPATFITRGDLDSKHILLSLFGIAVILALIARKVRGAILIGILAATAVNLIFGGSLATTASWHRHRIRHQHSLNYDSLTSLLAWNLSQSSLCSLPLICLIALARSQLSATERNSWKRGNSPKPDAHS